MSDGNLFWQVVNLLSDQTAHRTDVCGVVRVEIGDSGSLDSLLNYAKKGSEQLRRAALALIVTWAEDRLRAEEDWLDPFVQEHYRLLAELGYLPWEVETQELASARGDGDPETEGDQTERDER